MRNSIGKSESGAISFHDFLFHLIFHLTVRCAMPFQNRNACLSYQTSRTRGKSVSVFEFSIPTKKTENTKKRNVVIAVTMALEDKNPHAAIIYSIRVNVVNNALWKCNESKWCNFISDCHCCVALLQHDSGILKYSKILTSTI